MKEKYSQGIGMKNIVIFPELSRVRHYQLKCALLLTSVPLFCTAVLASLIFCFSQLNLYYLENGGLLVSEVIRQAYHDRIQTELLDVAWLLGLLFVFTFSASIFLMGWAVSPFINAERVLLSALTDTQRPQRETDWLSESPAFHKVIWGLAQRLRDKKYPFDQIEEAKYKFNYRFFFKFALSYYLLSLATSYVLGVVLNTVYMKIVNIAISSVTMKQKGYYFLAQEELLRKGVTLMAVVSCLVYAVVGYYVTRYMSNMLFVFTRAVREHHFPLKLRDSDVYHGLANAISEVAYACELAKK